MATSRPRPAPNRVDPGWLHELLARLLLKLGKSQANAAGLQVDVGDLKDDEPIEAIATGDESENASEPVDLLSRIIAHIFHRTPGVKRIEKRLEGRDKSSGFGSDLAALIAQIYRRNKPMIEDAVTQGIARYRAERAAKEAAKEAAKHEPEPEQPDSTGFAVNPLANGEPHVHPQPQSQQGGVTE